MYYSEFGIGNPTMVSTELPDESRINVWLKGPGKSWYIRIWVNKTVWILDSNEGFKVQTKTRKSFKLLIGKWI